VLLSKPAIQKLIELKGIVEHTDQPTINDIVQSMVSDYQILAESDVALVCGEYGYEMIDRKEIEDRWVQRVSASLRLPVAG
jgi:hypothetical protein